MRIILQETRHFTKKSQTSELL